MATVTKWTPFGVALDITATGGSVKRTSATAFTVNINASWETYYEGAQTNYGMSASSGGVTKTISTFGTKRSSGSTSFTGTYSISGNGAATKTITVTFKNYEEDWQGDVTESASKSVSFSVSVPAWTSYAVRYNANGGTGAPSAQTKWKDQTLTLSSTKPTRTGYAFKGWATSSSATSATYAAGGKYTANAGATLYAVWEANKYLIRYDANGGTGAPSTQTKTYGKTLTLSNIVPTRTNYYFKGWSTSASATSATYEPGDSYTANSAALLYAVWSLAYVKPRITKLTVARCDADGNLDDNGAYAKVEFSYSCDAKVSAIDIEWSSASGGSGYYTAPDASSLAQNGTFSTIIGGGKLTVESTYDIEVTVADDTDYSDKPATLNGTAFVVDFRKGGKGVAFGKPAEIDNIMDIAYQTRLLGGLLYPTIKSGTDLNDLRTPNMFIGDNTKTAGYANCPLTVEDAATFTLEVLSAGPSGQVLQRVTRCYKTNPTVYERLYYSSSWGEWYGAWVYPALTSNFDIYNNDTNNRPRYRKDGRVVEVRGIVTPTATLAGSNDILNIFNEALPVGYRPNSAIYVICQGSGVCMWLLRIASDGTVGFSRYRSGPNLQAATAGTWLPFQVTYIV